MVQGGTCRKMTLIKSAAALRCSCKHCCILRSACKPSTMLNQSLANSESVTLHCSSKHVQDQGPNSADRLCSQRVRLVAGAKRTSGHTPPEVR